VQCFDNIAYLRGFQSDWLCRLATGGGWATRELYADDEETIFQACRPLILNGIEDLARRDDLRDRAIILEQPVITEHARRDEQGLWIDFETARPALLGALFDAVSSALRLVDGITLEQLPRMADFARWVVAAESALDGVPGTFLAAYTGNRRAAVEFSLESSPVAMAIAALLDAETPSIDGWRSWRGKTETLRIALEKYADEESRRAQEWPRNARSLTNTLKRLAPTLRTVGIDWLPPQREKGQRDLELRKAPTPQDVQGVPVVPVHPVPSDEQYSRDERAGLATT
jgi:hypothetical protein